MKPDLLLERRERLLMGVEWTEWLATKTSIINLATMSLINMLDEDEW